MTENPAPASASHAAATPVDPSAPPQLGAHVALIVVDLQEMVRTLPYTHPIAGVLDNAGRLARAFRASGRTVVETLVAGGTMTRADRSMVLPASIPPAMLALVPELDAQDSDVRVPKQHWGAFTGTALEQTLRKRGITDVVITGVATGFGVESTARQASELGFDVTIATDAMSDMNGAVHERAVGMIFPAMAQCRTTDAVLAALEAAGPEA